MNHQFWNETSALLQESSSNIFKHPLLLLELAITIKMSNDGRPIFVKVSTINQYDITFGQ